MDATSQQHKVDNEAKLSYSIVSCHDSYYLLFKNFSLKSA